MKIQVLAKCSANPTTTPALGIFYVVYEISGNLIAGVVVGFALHFVTLVFSPKISTKLTSWMSEAQTPGDTLAT